MLPARDIGKGIVRGEAVGHVFGAHPRPFHLKRTAKTMAPAHATGSHFNSSHRGGLEMKYTPDVKCLLKTAGKSTRTLPKTVNLAKTEGSAPHGTPRTGAACFISPRLFS